MNIPNWLLLTSYVLGFLGMLVVAYFGYLGNKRIGNSKADQSYVDLLKSEISELKAAIIKLEAALLFSDNERRRLTDENIQLMRKLVNI